MNFDNILKPLENLYSVTGMDWNYSISGSLTEPTCPTICIKPETTNVTRYRAHCDTVDIEKVLINLVYRVECEVIKGMIIGQANTPFTNSHDKILTDWLVARTKDPNTPFPANTFYNNFYNQKGK